MVGGGFGGLAAARGLAHGTAEVVVVDRANHHLFQPLLYQVATGVLAPADIAPALRQVLARRSRTRVVLGTAEAVEPDDRVVRVATPDGEVRRLRYDYLVVAAGAEPSYLGHDDWAVHAPPMKSLRDAVDLRDRLFTAFEAAAVADDPEERRRQLTFAVVGGGPTGVELAGQLAALARRSLPHQFHDLDTTQVRIVLADAGDALIAPFPGALREHARRSLEHLGVEVLLGWQVTGVDDEGIDLSRPGAGPADSDPGHGAAASRRVDARTVVWAAGVQPVPLTAQLAHATGAPTDHKGRIQVTSDCSVPGRPEIFAIGDLVDLDGLPGIAEPAIQEGRHVARVIRHRLGEGEDPGPFRYRDLGTMATISPTDAVADLRGLRLRGVVGKLAWAVVHLAFLVGWTNRVAVWASWLWSLSTRRRRHQVILGGRRAQR